MKLILTITINTDAFAEFPLWEAAAILEIAAEKLRKDFYKTTLYDAHGNQVGEYIVTDQEG